MRRRGASDGPGPDAAWSRSLLVVTGFVLLGAFVAARQPVNHDVAWYLYAAQRWLDGARLYRDVVDVNPPLIFVLSALPAWVAQVSGTSDILWMKAAVLALSAASLLAAASILRRWPQLAAGSADVVLALVAWTQLLLIGDQWGQREHLLWVLVAPYLLAAAPPAGLGCPRPSRGLAAAVGLGAGLGLALKPYFLLIWLAVEACRAVITRSLRAWQRPENAAIAVVLATYGLLTILLTPDYFRHVVPLARQVYDAYDATWLHLLTHRTWLVCLLAVGLLAALGRHPLRPAAAVLAAAAAAGLLAAVVQRKGWDYHFYPATAAAWVAVAAGVWGFLGQEARLGSAARRGAAVTILVLAGAALLPVVARWPHKSTAQQWYEALGAELRGRPLAALSLSVFPAFPLTNMSRAEWVLRYNCLWPLAGWYPTGYPPDGGRAGRPREPMSSGESQFLSSVVDDLVRKPPAVLLVDTNSYFPLLGGNRFDFLAYFRQDPRFAELLGGYERVRSLGGYEVLRRREPSR